MSTQEQAMNSAAEEQLFKGGEASLNTAEQLQLSLKGLDKFGGFQLIKGLIKGAENMDPRRKAVKNIFLTDSTYEDTRKKFKNELDMWIEILENGGSDPMEIIDICNDRCEKATENLSNNLYNIHEEIRELEVAYRALDSFFANAGQSKVDCITLMNVDKNELESHDSEDTVAVRDELEKYYDRLSLKNNSGIAP